MTPVIQRDYIERLIEQCAAFLSRILQLRRAGLMDAALGVVSDAADQLLGSMRPLLERLDAGTAVDVAGRFERDRIRMYAALLGEEGLIHRERGDSARAYLRARRSLEFYAAVSLAGARLADADLERIAVLATDLELDQLDARYRNEIERLAKRDYSPG